MGFRRKTDFKTLGLSKILLFLKKNVLIALNKDLGVLSSYIIKNLRTKLISLTKYENYDFYEINHFYLNDI